MWKSLFKVMDDIKESVRNSADMTAKTLSRICINLSDPTQGKTAAAVTTVVLPVLLETGLGSSVKSVQALSLSSIMKMSKNAGVLLKPHIPLLVSALLEALSSLEPQEMNYLSLQFTNNQDTAEKVSSRSCRTIVISDRRNKCAFAQSCLLFFTETEYIFNKDCLIFNL